MDGAAEVAERIHAFPRQRTYLLPALQEVQHAFGWLPGSALELVGAHLRVPKSEVYGIASSFPDLLIAEPPEHVVRSCAGASCRMAGAAPTDGQNAADCLFICGVGPALEVDGRLVGRGGAPPQHLAVEAA